MKEIKAQLSSDILRNILPLSAIDTRRDVLTKEEADALFNLWKEASETNGRFSIPLNADRMKMAALRTKGYIESDSISIDFTQKGKEAIKQIVLSSEENTFKKKAKK